MSSFFSFLQEIFCKIYRFLRNNGKDFARRFPCGVMACGVLCVLLPRFLFPGNIFLQWSLPALFLLLAPLFFPLSIVVWKFAFPGLLVFLSLLFQQEKMENDPVKLFANDREQVGIVAIIRAEDPSLFGNKDILANPKRIHCRLLMGAYSPLEKMRKIDGKVLLRVPETFDKEISYGDILIVTGYLRKPVPPLFAYSFNYRSYLKNRSIQYMLHAYDLEKSHRERSLTSFLLDLRRDFSEKIFSLLPEENRAFIAALLFGCAQNVKRETKSDLIRTGTIHILTVSGLHTGFFAAFIAVLFIFFPFQLRMFLIPVFTLFYAWMTGMNMPAVRALVMLSSYCIARGCFYNSNPNNSLFFAFTLLMILFPAQLGEPGLHYSFITTFALLLAAENISCWSKVIFEKYAFIPSENISFSTRLFLYIKRRLLQVFAGCLAAWGISSMHTLFYQGILTPYSVMVNFLFIPFVWLCFPVFFLGTLLSFVFSFSGNFSAYILEKLTQILMKISHFAAGTSDMVMARPAWAAAVLFLCVFLLFLREQKRKYILLFYIFILGGLAFLFSARIFLPQGEVLIITGGEKDHCCIIVSIPRYDYAFLMDAVNYEMVNSASSYLRARGQNKINTLVSRSHRKSHVSSLKYLFRTMKVNTFFLPEISRKNIAHTVSSLQKKVTLEGGHNRTLNHANDPFISFTFYDKRKIKEVKISCFDKTVILEFLSDRIHVFEIKKNNKKALAGTVFLHHRKNLRSFAFAIN